ncbi:MAG TPA: type 4a pilus biogenesis protein PilO [Candidatus Angelobacter sp.]|jgi:Tfp pilus assembly protein PilO|nr:type 4a pilus biogenesis protein PilO [Candidatus Angelobacter sp.]
MTPLGPLRKKFIIVLAALAVVDLGLTVYLLWPGRATRAEQQREEHNLRQQFTRISREVEPLQGMDQKLIKTREDVKKFYKQHVANRWSEVSEEINKLAQENGFAPPPIHYKTEDTGVPDLQRVKADITLSGDYPKIARFINALERDKLLFDITQISLNGQQGAGSVELQIKVDTFLKETT